MNDEVQVFVKIKNLEIKFNFKRDDKVTDIKEALDEVSDRLI